MSDDLTDSRSRDQYPVDDDQDGRFQNIDEEDAVAYSGDVLGFDDIPPDGDPADGYEVGPADKPLPKDLAAHLSKDPTPEQRRDLEAADLEEAARPEGEVAENAENADAFSGQRTQGPDATRPLDQA